MAITADMSGASPADIKLLNQMSNVWGMDPTIAAVAKNSDSTESRGAIWLSNCPTVRIFNSLSFIFTMKTPTISSWKTA